MVYQWCSMLARAAVFIWGGQAQANTAFTYQGQLQQMGNPSGAADLTFRSSTP